MLIQFIADATGRPVEGTLRILRSTHPGFTAAVEEVIWSMRFVPAELKGERRLPQVVQLPFQFSQPE